jgi:hypothetical protein
VRDHRHRLEEPLMLDLIIVGMVAWAVGTFMGHGIGYAKGKRKRKINKPTGYYYGES